jgi:hypothetical protein
VREDDRDRAGGWRIPDALGFEGHFRVTYPHCNEERLYAEAP